MKEIHPAIRAILTVQGAATNTVLTPTPIQPSPLSVCTIIVADNIPTTHLAKNIFLLVVVAGGGVALQPDQQQVLFGEAPLELSHHTQDPAEGGRG